MAPRTKAAKLRAAAAGVGSILRWCRAGLRAERENLPVDQAAYIEESLRGIADAQRLHELAAVGAALEGRLNKSKRARSKG